MLVCAHLGALRAVKLQKGGEAKGKQESQERLAAPPLCFLLGGLGGAACGFRLAKEARGHGGCREMEEEHQGWHQSWGGQRRLMDVCPPVDVAGVAEGQGHQ